MVRAGRIAVPKRAVPKRAVAMAVTVCCGAAAAQQTPQPPAAAASAAVLAPVVVTAERRVENIKDVPSSVSTLSGEALDAINASLR